MQSIFKRYEKKYILTRAQGDALQNIMSWHMAQDRFGAYLVQNLYYDTENWDVIRASIEKPLYKEKMRLRCYGVPNRETNYFLELKKKYKDVVYKRRIAIPHWELSKMSVRDYIAGETSQIARELDFYLKANAVSERIYIAYWRCAFVGKEGDGLRITFDTDVRFRLDDLSFSHPDGGSVILAGDKILMEIKTLGGMPLWMAHTLSEYGIYPRAFSKFGAGYADQIFRQSAGCITLPEMPETGKAVGISA